MVGTIYETFVSGVQVHRSCREQLYGREALIVDVVERLAAFPDLQIAVENVIWQGNDDDGYRVSVRINLTGTNHGISRYGGATHKEIQQTLLMFARIQNERVQELWLAEDERSLVEQLGFDTVVAMESLEALDHIIKGDLIQDDIPIAMDALQRELSAKMSAEKIASLQLDNQDSLCEILSALWNGRQVGICERFYSDNFSCRQASNRQLDSREDYQALVLAQLATFPDLTFHIDEIIEQHIENDWHVGVRWTMLGTHTGPGIYGKPSGKRVYVMGMSHYRIADRQIISEYTEWNEFRLMQQIMERPDQMAESDLEIESSSNTNNYQD